MSKNFLLGHHLKQPTYPKNCSSDWITAFDCVLSSSDRLITPINYYKTHHQPNSFTHSHKFIILGSLDPYPISSGFGLQFVTLQKQIFSTLEGVVCFLYYSLGLVSTKLKPIGPNSNMITVGLKNSAA